MIRIISLTAMTGGFLAISPSLRGTAMTGLGRAMFVLDQYSPFSYIGLAIALGVMAIWSLATPKPQ